MEDVDYCNDPSKVALFPGVQESVARLKKAGFKVVIITNQSGIARKRITPEQYQAVHARLLELLGPDQIDATYYCPDFSERRKPSPAMVHEAAQELDLDLAGSYFVGDKESDLKCGKNAHIKTILVETGYGRSASHAEADYVVPDAVAAVNLILNQQHATGEPPQKQP
jgi:D-glycero-D-manno-heptose 1,7-bisphosphate phosphatase